MVKQTNLDTGLSLLKQIFTFKRLLQGLVLLINFTCVLIIETEARYYAPPFPNNLLGYVHANDFNPKISATVSDVQPNGIILLDIAIEAERATEMKVSLEPQFTYTKWQSYTPQIKNWRVTPQAELITLYAVFKRKNKSPQLGSSISPIVHYTLDFNNLARVIERIPQGYMDWTEYKLILEETYTPPEKNKHFFKLSYSEQQATIQLELSALRAFETIRVMPGLTVADLLYLEPNRREHLAPYLSLLSVVDIDYGRDIQDGRPVQAPPFIEKEKNVKSSSLNRSSSFPKIALQPLKLHDNINLLHNSPPRIRLIATLPFLENPKIFSEQGYNFSHYPTFYKQFQPHSEVSIPISSNKRASIQAYEGLVLDLRGTDYTPNLYPRLVSASGQVILSGDLYAPAQEYQNSSSVLSEPTAYTSQSFSHVPYVQYVRSLETTEFPNETLFVQPLEVSVPLHNIVIEDFYGTLILANHEMRQQMANGAFWIVID